MSSKMVFYPCKDVTLNGILSNAYATLPGILSEHDITLVGIGDSWIRREYMKIAGELILVAQDIILIAQKELELSGGITLDASELALAAKKEMNLTEGELVLTALLGMAAKKTLLMMDAVFLDGEVSLSQQKSSHDLLAAIRLHGDIDNTSMQKTVRSSTGIAMDFNIANVSKTVLATFAKAMLVLNSVVSITLKKPTFLSPEQILLKGSIKTVAIRYRTFADIEGFTFQDVLDWNMHTFFVLEV